MKIYSLLIFILLVGIGATVDRAPHAFYVSITELEIKDDTLQVSMRIFTDDLEKALSENTGKKVFLETNGSKSGDFVMIRDYLSATFGVGDGAKESKVTWLGHEFDDDVCWVYGQKWIDPKQQILFIRNQVLTEIYAQQQNMVHLREVGGYRTELATKSDPEVRFSRQ